MPLNLSALEKPEKKPLNFSALIKPSNAYTQAFQTGYAPYSSMVPESLLKTVFEMESSSGKNSANQKADLGQYGWLTGLTTTGHAANTISNLKKNPKLDYKVKNVPGWQDVSTPESAFAHASSALAIAIRDNPKMSLEDIYFKKYVTAKGSDTPQRRQQFRNLLKNNNISDSMSQIPVSQLFPPELRPAEIRAKKPTTTEKVVSKLPSFLQEGFQYLKEGFVGQGQEIDITGQMKFDTGLLGFLRPFGIGKPKEQKVLDRADLLRPLVESGQITERRADEIAMNVIQPRLLDRVRQELLPKKELRLTPEEKTALRPVRIEEGLDKIFGALDFVSLGTIKPITRIAATKIAKSEVFTEIADILMKEIPALKRQTAETFGKVLAHIYDVDDVQRIINKTNFMVQEAGKVSQAGKVNTSALVSQPPKLPLGETPNLKYKIGDKSFETLKEATNYKNELDNTNRQYMFEPSKRVDTTIRGVESPSILKETIPDLETKLKTVYSKVGESDVVGIAEADKILGEISAELETSVPGSRYINNEGEWTAMSSTFPKWLPEDLRSNKLFSTLISRLELSKLSYPTAGPRQRRLFDRLLDELDYRLKVDTSEIRGKINQQYEENTPRRVEKTIDRSPAGDQGRSLEIPRGKLQSPVQTITPEKPPSTTPADGQPALGTRVLDSPLYKNLTQIFEQSNLPTVIRGENFILTAKDKVRVPTARQLLKLEARERKAVLKAQDDYLEGIQKEIEDQLGAVGRAQDSKGSVELITQKLKEKGVSDEVINDIVLEDGTKLVEAVKIKREENGALSAIITKQQITELKTSYKGKIPTEKWIKRSVVKDAIKFPNKLATIYEVPQVYFERKGLKGSIYDPIREAQRGASQELTNFINRFKEAGLAKRGGWFTADRFTISGKEASNIGKYYLTRQGKGYSVSLENLSPREKKFVKIFDGIIKDTEKRFFEVARKNGKDPTKVENYAPIMTRKDIELIDKGGDMDFITRKHPSFFSTKERVENVPVGLYETDYREVVARWLSGITKFNSLGEVGVEVKYLIESEQFKEIVSNRDYQVIHDWFRSTMTPDIPKTEAVESINFVSRLLRKSSAIASLGLNYASVVKQALTQISLTIVEKAPPKFRSQFAKAFDIKVSDLPSITERKGDIAIVDLQGKIGRIFTGALTKFDQINAQKSLNTLLDKEYGKFLKGGVEIGPDQKTYILKQAQDRLDLWYGGMTKEQLPPAFRQEIGRFLNMFILPLTSQLNGFFQHILKAKGVGQTSIRLAEVLASVAVIAYLEQVITNLSPNWSDKKQMAQDILQSLGGNIPIVSQIVYSLALDQPIQISAGVSGISNLLQKINDATKGNITIEELSFALAETVGLPKQIRRIREGMQIIEEGGIRDKEGKVLAPVTETDEYIRSILRGKYGSLAAKDWIRNIGEKKENREWFVPQVEFLQNGDYERKAELYKTFSKQEQLELRSYLSEGQQKKLDKALKETPTKSPFNIEDFGSRKPLDINSFR